MNAMSSVQAPIDAARDWAQLYPEPPAHPVSEEEYYRWSERHGYVRAEWIDGEVSFMSPVGPTHDDYTWWIGALLRHFVEAKNLGKVKFDTWTRFQIPRPQVRGPDVLFVRQERAGIITDRNVSEPPDFVIEVVSPGDESRDYRDKFLLYEASRVREYWIVDPASESIEAYRLDVHGKYARYYEQDGKFTSELIPGWYLRSTWLWQRPHPDVLVALAELGVRTP
jgi:Uma2 family endonuclease